MFIIELWILSVLIAFAGGGYTATISRGWFPVRQPSNKKRIENAQTDKELKDIVNQEIQLETQRVKSEGELEFIRLEVDNRLEEKRSEVKMLTTGAEDGDIATLILATRKARRISQRDLAAITQMRPERISQIENHLTRDVTLDELSRLAAALQLEYHPPRFAVLEHR